MLSAVDQPHSSAIVGVEQLLRSIQPAPGVLVSPPFPLMYGDDKSLNGTVLRIHGTP